MQLVLHTPGLTLRVRGGAFEVLAGEEQRIIGPKQLSSIAVTAGCLISSAAVELAVKEDIPIYFFDEIGDAVGCLRSSYFESIATLRRKQVYFGDSPEGGAWVVEQFRLKTEGQISVLAFLADRRTTLTAELKAASGLILSKLADLKQFDGQTAAQFGPQLMGWEGQQARIYWQAVGKATPEPFTFQNRSRRPAQDPYNAVTNYLYGMLYTVVEQALFAAGLDPHLGMLHADEYDQPALAFDLIEAFRPWVDLLLLQQFCKPGVVQPAFFDARSGGIFLNSQGKKLFIPLFNEWLDANKRWQNRQHSHRLHIFKAAANFAKTINDWKKP